MFPSGEFLDKRFKAASRDAAYFVPVSPCCALALAQRLSLEGINEAAFGSIQNLYASFGGIIFDYEIGFECGIEAEQDLM